MPINEDGRLVVGAPRPRNNPIINRHRILDVGQARPGTLPHCYDPAFKDYTYGTPTQKDGETAASIMFNWPKPRVPKTQIDHGRDFIKLNKMAAHDGKVRPSEVTEWRTKHEARIVTKPGDWLRLKNQCPVNLDRDHCWGTPNAIEPKLVGELISHKFEHEWVDEQLKREEKEARRLERLQSRRRKASPHSTSADRSTNTTEATPSIADSYVMKKFRNVPSKVHHHIHRSTPEPQKVSRMPRLDGPRSVTAPGFRDMPDDE
mmetsp:Transcript_11839/g.21490  ORF Transcript_11839/g.21490 Transcript_11839/m.21490 type:complete len:261 (-) Transcript_11839:1001-1783(-)